MDAVQVVGVAQPLELRRLPIPQPGPDQVVVKQQFSSVNPLDYKVQHAVTQGDLPLPVTIGWDISGIVTQIGSGVTKFRVGDPVFGFTNIVGGALAEYVLVNVQHIVLRKNLEAAEAGVLPVVFTTAWVPLFVQDDISKRKGQSIYIAGGSGGIGHIAIQLAKYYGMTVYTSASKPDGIKLCADVGADHVINYHQKDVVEEILRLTENKGVDMALDTTYNARSFVQAAKLVKPGGRWYRIGNTLNQIASADEAVAICNEKGVKCDAGDLRRYWVEPYKKDVGLMTEALERCDELVKAGIHPYIMKTVPFTFDAVAQAVEESGTGKHLGKCCVKFN
jgi:NADPH:quinone reductase-like Zn-dependent oxidoreductase